MIYDAIVVGGGPNGLAAAITLARAGKKVVLFEAADRVGGGMRSAELTLPGFVHDICSAVHPLAAVSPFFRSTPLDIHGLDWVNPEIALAHPINGDRAASLSRSLVQTSEALGKDADAYRALLTPFCNSADQLWPSLLGPLRWPVNPWLLAKFGLQGLRSAHTLVDQWFGGAEARALFAGMAAHSMLSLSARPTAAVGLLFAIVAHAAGWPFPRGSAERIAWALRDSFASLGGEIVTDSRIESLAQLPPAKAILFDLSPQQITRIAAAELPSAYCQKLLQFRGGPGVFKLDWALDGPIPWRAEVCHRAATVHVGGTFEEVAQAEQSVCDGRLAARPFVLLTQQSRFDPTRAPADQHTGWAYCHVPPACDVDMTDRIESQVERFAPGFRDRILARHRMYPRDFEAYNANYVRGDISGGAMTLWQAFARPVARLNPYRTPSFARRQHHQAQAYTVCAVGMRPRPLHSVLKQK